MKPFPLRCKRIVRVATAMLLLALAGCVTYPYYSEDGVYYGRGYDEYGYSGYGGYGYSGSDYYYPYPYYAYPGSYGRSFYSFSYYDYSPYYRYPHRYYSGGRDYRDRHDEHPGESGDARHELRRINAPRRPPSVSRSPIGGHRIHIETPDPVGGGRSSAPRTGVSTPRPRPSTPAPAPRTHTGAHNSDPVDRLGRPRHRDR